MKIIFYLGVDLMPLHMRTDPFNIRFFQKKKKNRLQALRRTEELKKKAKEIKFPKSLVTRVHWGVKIKGGQSVRMI